MRREEVAQEAGVGVTWYTWLEQGRDIKASGQVLDAVARALRLDEAEREHLYHLADVPLRAATSSEPTVSNALIDVLRALDPLPAMLMNSRWDLLATNDAYRQLFLRILTTSFAVTEMPECRVIIYTPADDETRTRLPLTRTDSA